MADPVTGSNLAPVGGPQPIAAPDAVSRTGPVEKDFKQFLLESLEKVNQLQAQADEGVQRLLSGETDNVAEVFSASRKAGIAFDLLMEIRNKLMDAYGEIKQMRV